MFLGEITFNLADQIVTSHIGLNEMDQSRMRLICQNCSVCVRYIPVNNESTEPDAVLSPQQSLHLQSGKVLLAALRHTQV